MKQQCFSSLKRLLLFFHKTHNHMNNGNTKIVNLLNGSDNEYAKYATKNGMLLKVSQKLIIHTMIQ